MVAATRLDSFAPDVAAALRSASPEAQRRVAEFAAGWAVTRTGLAHPALASADTGQVAALVTELDDRYFAVSEARDAGRASSDDVDLAFGRARAAGAVEFARRGEAGEAIYEASAAVKDWSELRAAVLSQLR